MDTLRTRLGSLVFTAVLLTASLGLGGCVAAAAGGAAGYIVANEMDDDD